jgi:phage shock protein A
MALINRVARLFRADFHAVLDQIEEPELLLRQAIREMEGELCAAEERMVALDREQSNLRARASDVEASLIDVDRQLDLSFRAGKDDLARGFVRRKLEAERLLKRLRGRIEVSDEHLAEERRQAEKNRLVLDSMRQKADLFVAGPLRDLADGDDTEWLTRDLRVGDDDVEIAFLQEKESRSVS